MDPVQVRGSIWCSFRNRDPALAWDKDRVPASLFGFPHPGPFSTPNLRRTFIAAFAGAFFGSVIVQAEEDVLQVLFSVDYAAGYVAAD
jgi:hypothetical protein